MSTQTPEQRTIDAWQVRAFGASDYDEGAFARLGVAELAPLAAAESAVRPWYLFKLVGVEAFGTGAAAALWSTLIEEGDRAWPDLLELVGQVAANDELYERLLARGDTAADYLLNAAWAPANGTPLEDLTAALELGL